MIGLLASGCVAVGGSPDGVNGDAVLTPPPASAFEAGKKTNHPGMSVFEPTSEV